MNEDVNDERTVAVSAVEEAVLDLLDQDIIAHPEWLQPITAELARRAPSLVDGTACQRGWLRARSTELRTCRRCDTQLQHNIEGTSHSKPVSNPWASGS
jgi:hypothetical protein